MIIKYNPRLKELAKKLRKNSTLSEVLLWNKIKDKQVNGYDFHRQKPIDEFIIDFFCPDLALAIEIDGASHDGKLEKDDIRQEKLERLGIKFLRFNDSQVKKDMDSVIRSIQGWVEDHT